MEKLYHYCSIDTLKLILKNQTIRFSSLSTVDDMEESKTIDGNELGKVCFVSCWTDLKEDTVDMWRSYTNTGKGIRIGLPKDFFHEKLSDDEKINRRQDILKEYDISVSPPYVPILAPITYTKDDSLIELSVLRERIEKCDNCGNKSHVLNFETKLVGRFKRNIWASQSEWRYILYAIPYQYFRNNEEGKYLEGSLQDRSSLMRSDLINMEFKSHFIDYQFDKNAFKNLEILTSPLNTEEENRQIQKLVTEYIPDDQILIEHSSLQIRR